MDALLQPTEQDAGQDDVESASRDRWVAGGIAAVCLTLYLRTLLPGIGYSGDSAKWQFLGHVGGVPHATGHPLYLLLNKLFVAVVPWGSLAWRANLLSAVLGVLVVVLLYQVLRLLGVSWAVAASTALVFAFTRTFWTQSVVAEVYTLHLALMCAVMLCLARWRLALAKGSYQAGAEGTDDRWLMAGLSLYVLSFGNHMGTVLLLPGVVWLIWPFRPRVLSWRNVSVVSAAAIASVLQYGYVFYLTRVGRYVEYPVYGLGDALDYVTGASFRERMFAFGPAELVTERLRLTGRFLFEEYFVLLPLIGYGIWHGLRETDPARRAVLALVALWGVAGWLFAVNFDVVDVVVFFLPSFLVLAVFLGVGLDEVLVRLRQRRPESRHVAAAVSVALVALPMATGLIDYRRASQRGTVADAERIELALETAGRDAVFLTDGYHDSEYFWYFLLGEDMESSHNLALVHMVRPAEVRDYLEGTGGRVAEAVEQVREAMVPDDPDEGDPLLYTAAESQANDLRDAGLEVTEVTTGVWQVAAPTRPLP